MNESFGHIVSVVSVSDTNIWQGWHVKSFPCSNSCKAIRLRWTNWWQIKSLKEQDWCSKIPRSSRHVWSGWKCLGGNVWEHCIIKSSIELYLHSRYFLSVFHFGLASFFLQQNKAHLFVTWCIGCILLSTHFASNPECDLGFIFQRAINFGLTRAQWESLTLKPLLGFHCVSLKGVM